MSSGFSQGLEISGIMNLFFASPLLTNPFDSVTVNRKVRQTGTGRGHKTVSYVLLSEEGMVWTGRDWTLHEDEARAFLIIEDALKVAEALVRQDDFDIHVIENLGNLDELEVRRVTHA